MKKRRSPYASIARSSLKASGHALTVDDLEKAIGVFKSEEYKQREEERLMMMAKGQAIILSALDQGIITESEYIYLGWSIGINGALIVSPKMAKRLKKVTSSKDNV